MGRYIGPKSKIARKFGEAIFGTDKSLEKKNYPPGQHGLARKRKKVSEYGTQLLEKQKAKAIYGVQEKQFKNLFAKADRKEGQTGENLLILLERRLDNTVFRMGMAENRIDARQLVLHGHFTLNGKKVTIPSMSVKVGDVIAVKESSRSSEKIKGLMEALESRKSSVPKWLDVDTTNATATVVAMPQRDDVDFPFEEHLIVELYSK